MYVPTVLQYSTLLECSVYLLPFSQYEVFGVAMKQSFVELCTILLVVLFVYHKLKELVLFHLVVSPIVTSY
jgi:hypothetical protein